MTQPRPRPEDVQAAMCAALFGELAACGVAHVVTAPGSRSTPLTLAALSTPGLDVHVHHDERSAAFLALGIGLATGRPAAVVTTSGTAAVELHPAVVEAHEAGVPLLLLTADRPPELRDVAAPQAIDQTRLYGTSVRWFHDPGVPALSAASSWRSTASRAVAEATGRPPGPVHLNLPFREPLVGDAGAVDLPDVAVRQWRRQLVADRPDPALIAELVAHVSGRRGVIVTDDRASGAVLGLVDRLGWPILAGCRAPLDGPGVISSFDSLLREPGLAEQFLPEVVLRVGELPASRVLAEWTHGRADHVQIGGHRWIDPGSEVALRVDGSIPAVIEALGEQVLEPAPSGWLGAWRAAEQSAQGAIAIVLAAEPAAEPAVARAVIEAAPPGGVVVVSSSMPIRDLEWFGGRRRSDVAVVANRGANGIDGVLSTAIGVAIGSSSPVTLLIGDVALLHDSNGLLGLARRSVDLSIVVIDNDGGGIFSFLPQAQLLDVDVFEQAFGTPHDVDLVALAAVHDLRAERVADAVELRARLVAGSGGTHMFVVQTDRRRNVELHSQLNQAVAKAVNPEN